MSIEAGLRALLAEAPAVAALAADRIYGAPAPAAADAPLVTYQLIGETPQNHLSGAATLARATFQVDSWAGDFDKACDLGDAVRDALNGFNGSAGGVAFSTIVIMKRDDFDETAKLWRRMVEIAIWFNP